MNVIKAILQRRSSRTFNGLHLDSSTLTQIDDMCRQSTGLPVTCEPELFHSTRRPDIMLLHDFKASGMLGTYGVIKGACSFIVMCAGDSCEERMLGGFLMERILLKCTAMGIGTCWLGGTFGKNGFQSEIDRLSAISGKQSRPVTIVSPLGHCTPKTRFAERVMRHIVSADSRKPFSDLFNGIAEPDEHLLSDIAEGSVAVASLTIEDKLALALECVRRAPSSTNSQPWRATVRRNLKGRPVGISFSCAANGKLTPYDMGIAYCHFIESSRALCMDGALQANSKGNPYELFFSLTR